MQLDVHLDVVRKAAREQLRLLQRRELARARHACLEGVQICADRRRERKAREVRQMISTERRPKMLMAEASELLPLRPATVAFQNGLPQLGRSGEVIRRQPYPVSAAGLLPTEELLALGQPVNGVLLAVIRRK